MANGTSETSVITLDLTQPLDVRSFNSNELLQQEALGEIHERIARVLERAKAVDGAETTSRIMRPRSHEALTVLGTRGAGKTTFMLNVAEAIAQGKPLQRVDRTPALTEEQARQIEVLPLIDPTLIEQREEFLPTVIAEIRKRVVEALDNGAPNQSAPRDDGERWKDALYRLADGMNLMVPTADKGADGPAEDPFGMLDASLKRARSGQDFERDFHEFIAQSLRVLGKRAFLLLVDDVDTRFHEGWNVLETLRKYLTTPKLITVLSGDMEIYSTIVRGQQMNDLLPGNRRRDPYSDRYYRALMAQLQDQYLEKVLPLTNRVTLRRVSEILTAGQRDKKFRVKVFVTENDSLDLEDVIDRLSEHGLKLRSAADQVTLRRNLPLVPLRTFLAVLGAYSSSLKNNDSTQVDAAIFANALLEAVHGNLARTNTPAQHIRGAPPSQRAGLILDWVAQQRGWEDLYRLLPNQDSFDLNLAILALNAAFIESQSPKSDAAARFGLLAALSRRILIPFLAEGEQNARIRDALWNFLNPTRSRPLSAHMDRVVGVFRAPTWWSPRGNRKTVNQTTCLGTINVSVAGSNQRNAQVWYLLTGKSLPKGEFPKDFANRPLDDGVLLGNFRDDNKSTSPFHEKIIEHCTPFIRVSYFQGLTEKKNYRGRWLEDLKDIKNANQEGSWVLRLMETRLPQPGRGGTLSVLSVQVLLGNLLHFRSFAGGRGKQDLGQRIQEIGREETAPLFSWDVEPGQSESSSNEEEWRAQHEREESERPDLNEPVRALAGKLQEWVDIHADGTDLAASLRAKPLSAAAWTRIGDRIVEALSKVDEELTDRDKRVGHTLHRMSVAVLNAVSVEELRENGHMRTGTSLSDKRSVALGVRYADAVTSSEVFLVNLDSLSLDRRKPNDWAKSLIERAPNFASIFASPVWGYFFQPSLEMWGDSINRQKTLVNNNITAEHLLKEELESERRVPPGQVFRYYARLRQYLGLDSGFDVFRHIHHRKAGNEYPTFPNLYPVLNMLYSPGFAPGS